MSSKVLCYLRTLRNEWGLTQEELASLLPKGDRNRVSRVERSVSPPNAAEILAYSLIFGVPAPKIFRGVAEKTDEAVIRRAYSLDQCLEKDGSATAQHRRKLLAQILARAINRLDEPGV